MRKKVILLSLILIVLGGMIAFLNLDNQKNATSPKADSQNSSNIATKSFKKACDILTLNDAKTILGNSAILDNNNSSSTSGTADIQLSSCYYSFVGKDVSISVRSAKTDIGAQNNQRQFSINGLPKGAVIVNGYGDSAFWNPELGQFNILKHNNWYILSNGTINIKVRTLDDAKALANSIETKL